MRVPPELDRLMWAIAEEDNSNAADEFGQRYPAYRDELARRRSALTGLRAGKPASKRAARATASPIPNFTPRKVRPLSPHPAQIAAASVLALAAVGAAAFLVTKSVTPPSPTPAVVVPVPPGRLSTPEKLPPSQPSVVPNNSPVLESPASPPARSETPTPRAARTDLPEDLVVKRAGLQDVIDMLGREAGLTIVLAPGMPNPDIQVEYRGMPAMEILRDLGRQYNFTAFDQGDGTVVIYPAIDSVHRMPPAAGPVRRIGG